MVKDRQNVLGGPLRAAISVAVLLIFVQRAAADDGGEIRLTQAAERGAFYGTGTQGNVQAVASPHGGGDVLKLDYTVTSGTDVGAWTKGFPSALGIENADIVRPSIWTDSPEQAESISVALEIKGSAGVQQLHIGLGARHVESLIDWHAVGTLREVVVSVKRVGAGSPVAGTLWIDVRFGRLSTLRKLSLSPTGRFGEALLAGLIAAALARLVQVAGVGPLRQTQGMARDVIQGLGVVAIAGLALGVEALGGMGPLEVGAWPMVLALAGAAIAAWWTLGLTGRLSTPAEALRDALATGVLAAAVGPLSILQAPATWSDLFRLSQPVAAALVCLYLGSNAVRLATSGKHLSRVSGWMIVATPFAVGWLLLLEANGMVKEMGEALSLRLLASRPDVAAYVGRVIVVFGFNEIVTTALGLATRRGPLRSARSHLQLLGLAAWAAAGPWIAAAGSGDTVARWEPVLRWFAAVATTVLAHGGLWAEAYLLTGLVVDAIHGAGPSRDSVAQHPTLGMRKGMVYSGAFMTIVGLIGVLSKSEPIQLLSRRDPLSLGLLFGVAAFPLVKTIIETFDGSQAFFRRLATSYRKPMLYARGAVVGLGLGYAFSHGMPEQAMATRVAFGLGVGAMAYAGINFIGDLVLAWMCQGRVQSWRVYLVQGLLGGAIGAGLGFYLDAAQVTIIVDKFHRYTDPGQRPWLFDRYPLLSKWGRIVLGEVRGGPSLLYAEALAGVLTWAIPSWLFALNRTFMAAYFDRDAAQIRSLFSKAGLVQLIENMIGVLRWGLWMSPIIDSFLRPMAEPTWYNQDGAIRTVIATVHDVTSTPTEFHDWSLRLFTALLAYDGIRILIWLDHFGLRVSTLVNLSFLGMDRLDRRLARFLAPASTARCVPESVKRFTTWAPLLIPFYLPRNQDWDLAWSQSQKIQAASHGGILASLSPGVGVSILLGAVIAGTASFSLVRMVNERRSRRTHKVLTLANAAYEVTLRDDGAITSFVKGREYDVSRRSYDLLDPCGRALFVADEAGEAWNAVGPTSQFERGESSLTIRGEAHAVRSTIEITLPDEKDAAELWTITLENPNDRSRRLKVVPYLEWVLNRADADRGHTQYNRLFAEVEYAAGLHAVLAWDKHAKAMGVLAADVTPEGFLSTRVDFIGRARTLDSPRVLETFEFLAAHDTDAYPTFDPIGSLLLGVTVPPRSASQIRLLIGLVGDKAAAIDLVARHLRIPLAEVVPATRTRKEHHAIRHGEIPPDTPQPYAEFADDGRSLIVRTPFTPRPFDHTMSNELGHVVVVTNRGLHTTSSVNAQQNRLTPDWSDTVTREVPGEAIYLFDPASDEWFSPTYHPLNDTDAEYECEFSVDGTATFRMAKGTLETELTVFVPPDEPAGIYRLTIRNRSDVARRLRVATYFQIVLAGQPEFSGPLKFDYAYTTRGLIFKNPRNTFRSGPAFATMSGFHEGVTLYEEATTRGQFFGEGRGMTRPYLVEQGKPAPGPIRDNRPVAAFMADVEVPPRGERTVIAVLGQADNVGRAEEILRKYREPQPADSRAKAAADEALTTTRQWWSSVMETCSVKTTHEEFDRYLPWLRYQALAERIWARRGFYQASGAFGFRDQLQDSVNLLWMDPLVARRQILLHASQQFPEGDVVHWFHRLQDGRTGFVGRTHASDNLLWLPWAVVEYLAATGDDSLLDERTSYLESDLPFEPLPAGKGGMGFDPLRSSREDTVYRHCLRAIDLVLDQRMGVHGLPLMGTGDWNDGLDEIGSEGKGESVWLGLFLTYILTRMVDVIGRKDASLRDQYAASLRDLKAAIETTWRGDRYLRAYHDDGTEIGVKGSGVWEIDALTAAWAVMAEVNPERGRIVFETALRTLEREKTILLGWPPLREDTHPYLGRSSAYPEGVRENGMYCHGVQWLVGAARILADRAEREGRADEARGYRETAYRLWLKTSSIPHSVTGEIETFGGQPNQQAADMVTTFEPGRMIWNGYTGAAGWMFRQAIEGVLGFRLANGEIVPPRESSSANGLSLVRLSRDLSKSPFDRAATPRPPAQSIAPEHVNS